MRTQHVEIHIKGKVQGVYFRASTQLKARDLGLVGFVENQLDGSVFIQAEGALKDLEELLLWCHRGPEHARVDEVKHQYSSPIGYTKFSIRR